MEKALPLIFAVFIGLTACKKEKGLIDELRSSPEQVSIGANTLSLTTYLYRNFMPSTEGDSIDNKMICINQLTDANSTTLPSGIVLRKQYLIRGEEIWQSVYAEQVNDTSVIEGIVRFTPEWDTGTRVDVVCEFLSAGETYRIMAKSQLIHRVE